MHEMALAEGVLRICEDHARRAGADKVVAVWLEVGALSHVDPDALAFSFTAVVKGTLADGARLEIARLPGRAWCHDCGQAVPVKSLVDACPECGGYKLQVTAGEDMRVKEMEVA
ncbi:hydrogenase maturation nickel metallochaperone HypA [Marimonas arenosa]|uniref:Hydrogenase maturation factor HypA n=1 Tax=Marimonas arenosa TaxID=1795305 RepID=A0AAE4B5W4_9RHOB|nr:hydrogenase maturation nickel metallochaperone HypA [Marimonas arenosa]MDQ2089736.1 hydrogenase maturation nickel metallochaperone HypA [Marimonas arenosa]